MRIIGLDGSTNVIRKGLEVGRYSDLVHTLLRMSWSHLLLFVVGFIALANCAFAFLYMLLAHFQGPVLDNVEANDFAQNFFFSVQTMATVGYGYIRPISLSANLVASSEAFFGLLVFAVLAGLIFSRMVRPTARVLFSKLCVVTKRNGQSALMFRIANERNSYITDAQIKVYMMRSEKTLEGEQIRSFVDLKLHRSEAPIFALSFTVVHFIDETSPLYGHTHESLLDQDIEIVVALSGVDEVFSQSVYARSSYILTDIRWNHKFKDVISISEQGLRVLDYTQFHEVEEMA